VLSPKQIRFAQEYLLDSNAAAAARRAGYSAKSAKVTGCRLLTNANLKSFMAAKQAESAEKLEIDREVVAGQILGAIALARSQGDGGNMIRGAVELGRLLGFYGPSVAKSAVPRAEDKELSARLDALSDQELMDIVAGKSPAPAA